ncbi:Sensor protein ZraS [Fundidesulfovibrio magnetotacticus]|uniref:histidine kinase n=1 Tax=Fundidesulfovibrio magnetotacticus TaxID=2730080 RepID=A0A6V8LVN7_9BACT|nr:PAS domain-containing sensor histidine kinase [Fundidesulfovibrio magnetotacticus]GFK93737.1 Sensor protein ZraS [Fundidesulfovibrio magnetotacticus]
MLGDIFRRHFRDLHTSEDAISPERYNVLKRKIVGLMALVTLLPLLFMSAINFMEFQSTMAREVQNPLRVILGKTRNTIELFLAERASTVAFVAQAYSYQELADERALGRIFRVIRKEFDGFVDMGLVDSKGRMVNYVGPYDFKDRDYSGQDWFAQVMTSGKYISDVFMGFRKLPHVVIAMQHTTEDGETWVVRATLDTRVFDRIIAAMSLEPGSDAFLLNRKGILQTSSALYGNVLEPCPLRLPPISFEPQVVAAKDPSGQDIYMSYAYFPNTDFVLMATKPRLGAVSAWYTLRGDLLLIFVVGVAAIFMVTSKVTGMLVNRMRESEERRSLAFRQVEHAQKLSSIGRLAAGVAHEINNPLAIINEKAGLMKDLLALQEEFKGKARFSIQVEAILRAVERCRGITHRMLGFARRMDVKIEALSLNEVIRETSGFLVREAEHRNVELALELDENLARIESDRGQLQQVILNILNNALAAVPDKGRILVKSWNESHESVGFSITDNGCGMSQDTLKCIFEPFFTTKRGKGTGLGLSITYGIIKRLGGEVSVQSKENDGSTFSVVLPVMAPPSAAVEAQ